MRPDAAFGIGATYGQYPGPLRPAGVQVAVPDVSSAAADFADVVLYFNQMARIAADEPFAAFDYNGNGRIDFANIVWLFNHL